ncbi:F-box domain-containing protein [Forsythia ovata]|uniref:F-box domain-containing protein n=1 Tax=Forsythia ovata TaxID=205694 RepID=A0ABD1NWK6_9LAMI
MENLTQAKNVDEQYETSDIGTNLESIQIIKKPRGSLKDLFLDEGGDLQKLPSLLRRAPQLVEFGTGAYLAKIRNDIFSNLVEAFSGCKHLKSFSRFWDVVPAYLPAMYNV